jgi:predicted AAA+ superfamily ATPase
MKNSVSRFKTKKRGTKGLRIKKRGNNSYLIMAEDVEYKYLEVKSVEELNFLQQDENTQSLDVLRSCGENSILVSMSKNAESDDQNVEIENGMYYLKGADYDVFEIVRTEQLDRDKFIDLGYDFNTITDEIDLFFNQEQCYHDLNFMHKKGVLLYGPPGNGKTRAITEIAEKYKDKAIIVYTDIINFFILNSFKKMKDRYFIFILEEVYESDTIKLDTLLLFLDGEYSCNHQLVLATTNYPEELPDSLIDRPGRFDVMLEMNHLNKDQRKKYLESVLPNVEINDEKHE